VCTLNGHASAITAIAKLVRRFDGDGDPMLPVPPDDELGSLHEGGDQSFGGSVTRRSAKTSRPKGGHLGKVQVPSIDSGVVGYGEAAQPDDF